MNNRQKQENKHTVRLKKTFRVASLITNLLLFLGGIAMLSFIIWLFIRIGEWANIGF